MKVLALGAVLAAAPAAVAAQEETAQGWSEVGRRVTCEDGVAAIGLTVAEMTPAQRDGAIAVMFYLIGRAGSPLKNKTEITLALYQLVTACEGISDSPLLAIAAEMD